MDDARDAGLLAALEAMVEHFATPTSERSAASYAKTNAQVAYEARAAIAAAKGADTEEQAMAMTITQEQRNNLFIAAGRSRDFDTELASLGITITPAEPPWEAAYWAFVNGKQDDPPSVRDTWQAALQHAVDVVKGAPGGGSGDHIRRAAILTAFGAGGRNA